MTRHAVDGEAVGDFELLLRALWKYQLVRHPVAYDDQWADLFFELTQGIPDLMVKLLESSLEAAIASGAETLSYELVRNVVEHEFTMTNTGVFALRTNERFVLDCVPDLHRPETDEIVDRCRPPEEQSPLPVQRGATSTSRRSTLPSPTPMDVDISEIIAADLRKAKQTKESKPAL